MAVVKLSAAPVAARLLRYMVKQKPNSKEPRVLFATGVNVRAETAEREFAAARRRYGQQGRGIQVRHVIQSFGLDELNPHDPADVARAHELGVLFAQECFPGVQALVVTQADGKG